MSVSYTHLILRKIVEKVSNKVIAEGNINTPEKAKRVIELGAYSVVAVSYTHLDVYKRQDVDRAVKAARKAFETWSQTTTAQRADILDRIAAVSYTHLDVYKRQPFRHIANLLRDKIGNITPTVSPPNLFLTS